LHCARRLEKQADPNPLKKDWRCLSFGNHILKDPTPHNTNKFRVPTSHNSEICTPRGTDKISRGPVKALSPFLKKISVFRIHLQTYKGTRKRTIVVEIPF
jgi:hypothetical protein